MLSQVIEFLKGCPFLENVLLTADILMETEGSYAVRAVDCEPVLYRYTDGGSLRQFAFTLISREVSVQAAETFYDGVAEWLENTVSRLPVLPSGQIAQRFEVLRRYGAEEVSYGSLRYGLDCRLIYYQEE